MKKFVNGLVVFALVLGGAGCEEAPTSPAPATLEPKEQHRGGDAPPPTARLAVTPAAVELETGGTAQLTATLTNGAPAAGVSWRSSAPAIATVSAAGLVTGVAAGSAVIVATSAAGTATSAVTVTEPPPVTATTIDLSVVRLAVGTGTVLVSNGIPLPQGLLLPGATSQAKVLVAGVEKPVYVEALAGTHPDGSARSLLVQFQHNLTTGVPVGAELVVGPGVSRGTADRAKVTPAGSPAAVALPSSPDYLVATGLVGPTVTTAAAPASPAAYATYEAEFRAWGEVWWNTDGGTWGGTYYDRPLIWYAWWARTGDVTYWTRGTTDALAYRDGYLVANNYNAAPHWSLLEGLELHYLLTGDEASRGAIGSVADRFADVYTPNVGNVNDKWMEGRIQSRTLLAHLTAWRLDARTMTGKSRGWAALIDDDLNKILATQSADGSYRFYNWCYEHSSYMTGLLNDVLIKTYTNYRADSRIPAAVKKALDFMWTTQWVAADGGFKYLSAPCVSPGAGTSNGDKAAPDLNMLIVGAYGWYFAQGGGQVYRDRGEEVWVQGVVRRYLNGSKQFNQHYRDSYHYLAWR